MMLDNFAARWLPALETKMRAVLACDDRATPLHYGMIHYHMGWVDSQFQPVTLPAGKRLRPLLCLMACQAVGGDPAQALPAAAAVEILHNFSLVHDDIEDGDVTRRHRPTLWSVWGVPQAINAGDAMFALAFAALQRLSTTQVAAAQQLAALQLFTDTSVALTEGQHLDMHFEQRRQVSVAEYLHMIEGKTAALIGASVALGGLVGGDSTYVPLRRFGQSLGLAFQIQDDLLGIWGDPAVTGKAAGNDILRRKKSLPLLHALNDPLCGEALHALLWSDRLTDADLPEALRLLEQAGARTYATDQMKIFYTASQQALQEALGAEAPASLLWATASWLMQRQS
ncbi:MAG: polyprenyl synthetase family protein [Caldilinea sp.]